MNDDARGFEEIKERLDQIVEAVSSDDVSLDDALALYEEAVKLGLSACDASELGVEEESLPVNDNGLPEAAPYASDTAESGKDDSAGEREIDQYGESEQVSQSSPEADL